MNDRDDGDSSGGEFVSDMVDHFKRYGSKRISKRISKDSPKTTKMKRRKTRVSNELLESERAYVNDLENLLKYIQALHDFRQSWTKLGMLKTQKIATSVRSICRLRPAAESLLGLHKSLLASLEAEKVAGRTLLQFASYMKMYSTYLDSLDPALDAASNLENQHSAFFWSIRVCDQDLDSLLVKPAQRVTRYTLLLKELLKNTPESDEKARTELDKAVRVFFFCHTQTKLRPDRQQQQQKQQIKSVSSSAAHCENLLSKRKDWIKFQQTVKKGWGGHLEEIAKGRPILHAGEVMKLSRKGKFHVKTFVCFQNTLAYGRRAPPIVGPLKISRELSLQTMEIAEVKDKKMLRCLIDLGKEFRDNSFQIECAEKSFVVCTFTRREKLAWVQTLKEAAERRRQKNSNVLASDKERRKTAPVWEIDTKACSVCDVTFGWRLWRHHCRTCGRCVCTNCATEDKDGDRERICVECIKEEEEEEERTPQSPQFGGGKIEGEGLICPGCKIFFKSVPELLHHSAICGRREDEEEEDLDTYESPEGEEGEMFEGETRRSTLAL